MDAAAVENLVLEQDFPSHAALVAQMRRTALHKLGHLLGISDARLHELDAY